MKDFSEFSGARVAADAARRFSERALGDGIESEGAEERIPFSERPEEEQIDLIYRIQSLVAQRRDLARTLRNPEAAADAKEATESPGMGNEETEVRMRSRGSIGKRRLPVMGAVVAKTNEATDDARTKGQERLDAVLQELQKLGMIPGLKEAYGKEVTKLYFYGKLLRNRERLLGERADLDFALRRERAKESFAGTPVGADLSMIESLEADKQAVQKSLDEFAGAKKEQEAETHASTVSKLREKLKEFDGRLQRVNVEMANPKGDDEDARESYRASMKQEADGVQAKIAEISEAIALERAEMSRISSEGISVGPFLDRVATLREYAESFQSGRIVEFPSVEKLVELGLENLRHHQTFTLAGHLGSGKTEVARHIAKLYMVETAIEGGKLLSDESYEEAYDRMKPEFFSGSEEASVYDIIGKLKIKREKKEDWSPQDVAELVEKHVGSLEGMSEEEGKALKDRILERVISAAVSGGEIETVFAGGPLERALREKKPIIFDEINMIPPQVLGRINDISIATIGRPIILQENGDEEYEITPGFGILGTFNVGRQYHGTQELNAAQANRWNGPKVDYPSMKESYDLILAALLRKDRVRLPPSFHAEDYEKLADLAIVTRHIQELFSGQTEGQRYMARRQGMKAEKSQLEKTVISTRDLLRKIILPWRDRGFKDGSLEEIIADNILATAGTHSEDDQRFLVELFLENGFFEGWTAKRFRAHHIGSIEDEDIRTIQNVMKEEEYKKNDRFREVREEARERGSGNMRSMLLMGRS